MSVVIPAEGGIQARLIVNLITIKERMLNLMQFLVDISLYSIFLFRPSASYFSLLAQRTSNQKKVHPSFRFYPVLLGLPGVHRNSP